MKGTIFSLFFSLGFNPRTHEGYDGKMWLNPHYFADCFNPRTHEGYDIVYNERNYKWYVLIPVPTEGTMIAASRSSTGM